MPPLEQRQKNAPRETRAINQYQLADCIGKGAFGAVYKALNMENGETVAIKQVKLSNIPRSELGVIMMEIDLLKKLNHPNIVKYNGFVKTKEYLNIILEFCENGSLTSIVKKFGKFPENLVAVYVVQVLEGLRYLHEQGVIHRDIKGANILTTKEGLVKLADFGVATRGAAPGSDAPVEEEAMVVGSPYWMAPEVIELSGATTASDVWSVGCTVIELLQGQPPYHDLAPMPALFRIVQDDHPPLPEGASGGLKDFLMQCFQKDYNLRVSAKKLLKHPWIQSARRKREAARETYGMNPMVNKFAEDVRSVQQWNAAINEPIHRHPFKKPSILREHDLNQIVKGRQLTGYQNSREDDNWDADFLNVDSLSTTNLSKPANVMFESTFPEANFAPTTTSAGTVSSPLSSTTSLNDRALDISRSPSPSKPSIPPGSLGIRKRLSAADLADQAEEAEDCWDNDFEVDDMDVAATRLVELKLRKSLEAVHNDGGDNDQNEPTRENLQRRGNPKSNERDQVTRRNKERDVNDKPGYVQDRQDRVVSIDEDNSRTITMNVRTVLQAQMQSKPFTAKPQPFVSATPATLVASNAPLLRMAPGLPPLLSFASSKYMESEADGVYDDIVAEEDENIFHEKLGKLNINFAGLKVGDTSRIRQRKPVATPDEIPSKISPPDPKRAWTPSGAADVVTVTTLNLSTDSLLSTSIRASDTGTSQISKTPKSAATSTANANLKPSNQKQVPTTLSARPTTTPVAAKNQNTTSASPTTSARSPTTAHTTTMDSVNGYKAAASRFFASFRDGRRNQAEQKVKLETDMEETAAFGDALTVQKLKPESLTLEISISDDEDDEGERPVRKGEKAGDDDEQEDDDDDDGCGTIVLSPGRTIVSNLPRDIKKAGLSKGAKNESDIPASRTGVLSSYAETDDDDYDDVLVGAVDPAGMDLENGGMEKAELKIRSRALSFGAGGMNNSPNGEFQGPGGDNCRAEDDEEEDDDPFASLEEGMDEPDLEENILRDKHARLCSEIESLIRRLQPEQSEDALQGICDELLLLLTENPTLRSNVITHHGVIPIMELLEQRHQPSTTDRVSANVVQKLLRIVNLIIEGSIEIQENFCLVGGVPCVTAFASSKYPFYVRLEAARFVRRVCQASTLSLQMFVSGRGLRVLAGLLAEDYSEGKELVLTAIDGVASVFELQGPTPKNDFCRLFANCGLLEPLASALSHVAADRDPRAQEYVARTVHVLLIFSQADAKVKELVATRPVVKKLLAELDNVPPAQTLGLVKCIKNLSMTSTALDTLEKAGAIETLAELLSRNSGPYITEMYNQVVNALYNLCRLNRRRQEAAALAGVVPPLQRLVKTNRPFKQFALPVLCDLAHAGKICRGVLWQNDGLRFYLSLMGDPYWQINALEAVSAWLSDEEEKTRLEAILVLPGSVDALSRAFLTSRTTGLEKLLDPLYKILVKAQGVARLLVERNGVAQKISERLKLPNAQVRLGVLRVLAALTETHPQPLALITKLGLQSKLHRLAAEDPGLLVRELAAKLAAGVRAPDPGTPIATPVRPRPEGRLPPVEKGTLRGG